MLQQHNLLGDRIRVVVEVVFGHLLNCVAGLNVSHTLNVHKVEQVGAGHDLGRVVEQHSKGTGGQLVAQTVLAAEIHEFGHEFVPWLLSALRNELCEWNGVSHGRLDLGQLRLARFLNHGLLLGLLHGQLALTLLQLGLLCVD